MKRTLPALSLLALWVAGLVVAGGVTHRFLSVGSDLRLFLPSPVTEEQRLLLQGLGNGPATRVLVVALDGAPPEQLADASRALADALHEDDAFRGVTNGDLGIEAFPDDLLPYRYLLSPTLDTRRFDEQFLTEALAARARDIASPAGLFLEPWLPRDPTAELLDLLQSWQPAQEPRREFDVWFDRDGRRALLLFETTAAAFDPGSQRDAIGRIETALASIASPGVKLTVSGAGQFSVLMEGRTRNAAQKLGLTATIGMIVLLLVAYRSPGSVFLSALPLVSAALAGVAAVAAVFGSVHGITLAFGFTLIGVAQDYPLHLMSHRRIDQKPDAVARKLWPTLATGIAGTCIAYLTFLFSGVTGIEQLACFTITGLGVAGITTRFLLPQLIAAPKRDHGDSAVLGRIWRAIVRLPRPRAAPAVLTATCLAVLLFAPAALWRNSLDDLTPVPADLLEADRELREQLGTPDLRYLLAVEGPDDESVLARLEALEPRLAALVDRGVIADFDHAAHYLPTAATQRARQAALPDAASLRAALDVAAAATPFRTGAFEPFVADVEQAHALAPLTVAQLRAAGLGAPVDALLMHDAAGPTAVVTFTGVVDVAALRDVAAEAGAIFLDLKQTSEDMVKRQRTRMLLSLSVGAVLLAVVIALALRNRERVLRVLAPMAITTLLVIAVLQAAGVSLTIFHLISLILVAGLGLDYALFFERAAADPAEQRRTLHAVLTCSLSTLLVFALLATSTLPVLRAIGLPVAIGVVSNFMLALLLTTPRETAAPAAPSTS